MKRPRRRPRLKATHEQTVCKEVGDDIRCVPGGVDADAIVRNVPCHGAAREGAVVDERKLNHPSITREVDSAHREHDPDECDEEPAVQRRLLGAAGPDVVQAFREDRDVNT